MRRSIIAMLFLIMALPCQAKGHEDNVCRIRPESVSGRTMLLIFLGLPAMTQRFRPDGRYESVAHGIQVRGTWYARHDDVCVTIKKSKICWMLYLQRDGSIVATSRNQISERYNVIEGDKVKCR